MGGIFSSLAKFGLSGMDSLDVYEKEEKNQSKDDGEEVKEVKEIGEKDLLFDKTYTCPVCDRSFKSKTVMAGKAKLLSTDTDLRPKYQGIDCVKYDSLMCNHCGYAVLTRFFKPLSSTQIKLIKENIGRSFKSVDFGEETYSYDDAIERYQMALANAIVKRGQMSERAYACLKLGWLMRGKAETMEETEDDYDYKIKKCKEAEDEYIKLAYDGFVKAMSSESFPICGMDEWTFTLVLADLARRSKDYEQSARLISQIITSRSASNKIKDRARDLKDLVKEEVSGK